MIRHLRTYLTLTCIALTAAAARAQSGERVEPLKFGDMEQWVVRQVKESGVIGGKTKTLYEVGPNQTITGSEPYTAKGGSPWGTSNVLAKVMGVVKTNTSVYRDTHGSGHCARLETHIEKVRVLGMMNISVIAAGSLYLGSMKEPITGTKDGPKAMNYGIRFTKRPAAVRFDYRVKAMGGTSRLKMTGFSSKSTVAGADNAVAVLFLQRRSENSKGEITAQRVGTMVVRYQKSTAGWVEGATYEILYGDITRRKDYDPELMALTSENYALNSKGKSVPIRETGWAAATATPTHLCLSFTSSHGGAYIGTPGNTLWVDNVKLVY